MHSGLRQRLANLFLQFINTPQYNPEATNFSSTAFVPVDAVQVRTKPLAATATAKLAAEAEEKQIP